MKPKTKIISIIAIVSFLAMAYAVYLIDKNILDPNRKIIQLSSTLCSIAAGIEHEIKDENPIILEMMPDTNNVWKKLGDEQFDRAILEILKHKEIEYWDNSGKIPTVFKDPWGNRLVICYYKSNQKFNFVVISKGPDGIYGTKDDISSNYKEPPPDLKITGKLQLDSNGVSLGKNIKMKK